MPSFLYGYDRIAQSGASGYEYFLPDALGSVRQMADEVAGVTLSQSFTPYGELLARGGIGSTSYDFAGEWTDPSGLQHLRARYYAPGTGTFISRDPWSGNVRQPASLNRYMYVQGNPVNFSDPSGLCRLHDIECRDKSNYLEKTYNIKLETESAISYKFLESAGIAHDFCVIGFPFDDYYTANPSSYWLTHELESIDSILAIFKDFLSGSKVGYFNTLGNGRTTIKKVYKQEGTDVPGTIPGYKEQFYYPIIELPIGAITEGNVINFGGTLSHELTHALDFSFAVHPSNHLASSDPFWIESSNYNIKNAIVSCGGPTEYSCWGGYDGEGFENFAESATIYLLWWESLNGSTAPIKDNAGSILNVYRLSSKPDDTRPALLPNEWEDNGHRFINLLFLFGR